MVGDPLADAGGWVFKSPSLGFPREFPENMALTPRSPLGPWEGTSRSSDNTFVWGQYPCTCGLVGGTCSHVPVGYRWQGQRVTSEFTRVLALRRARVGGKPQC